MTDRRKFRCLNVIKAVHFHVQPRSFQPAAARRARAGARRAACGGRGVLELVAYVKIRSGTEAVSMSATEGLSVDATVGCVYRGGSLLPLEYRVGLVVGAALTVELRAAGGGTETVSSL
jgi:hypothetical protein